MKNEYILYSNYANVDRAIPSCIDGLKPDSRKILHTMLNMNQVSEIQVAKLAGKVSSNNIQSNQIQTNEIYINSIVKLAQNYIGSNNINLLNPIGQFGTRLMGGKDSAQSQYLYTKLNDITKYIFMEEDKQVLNYCIENEIMQEPEYQVPIIPMILINGGEGDLVGLSTYIPSFNPRDVIKNVRNMIEGIEIEPMEPWYRGFVGEIKKVNETVQKSKGVATIVEPDVLIIEELPINVWTEEYKDNFLKINHSNNSGHIEDQFDEGDEHRIRFEIHTELGALDIINNSPEGLSGWFNLEKEISLNQMVLYNSDRRVYKQENIKSIFFEFYTIRYNLQTKRKSWLLKKLSLEYLTTAVKKRQMQMQLNGNLDISKLSLMEINKELHKRSFTPQKLLNKFHNEIQGKQVNKISAESQDDNIEFDQLMDIPIKSYNLDQLKDLSDKLLLIENEIIKLKAKDVNTMWLEDIKNLESELTKFELEQAKSHAKYNKKQEMKIHQVMKNPVKFSNNILNLQQKEMNGKKPSLLPIICKETNKQKYISEVVTKVNKNLLVDLVDDDGFDNSDDENNIDLDGYNNKKRKRGVDSLIDNNQQKKTHVDSITTND